MRPGAGAPGGRRSGAGSAAAAPPGGRVGRSRRARRAPGRTARCARRSTPRSSPSVPSRSVPPTSPTLLATRPTASGRVQAKRAGRRRATSKPANRTLFGARPQIPANGLETSLPAGSRFRILGGFRGSPVGEGVRMRILVTGVSGYVGAALAPALEREGHRVRGFARSPERVSAAGVVLDELVTGDALTGAGLEEAMDGMEVAYYLIHSMEGAAGGAFPEQERRGAERFAEAARAAGVRRVVYLGGLVPREGDASRHLASRLAVEEALLGATPESIALRASIVIGARSRSFRFLVRLIERLPVLALPAWRDHRTAPVDGRDMLEFLTRAATARQELAARSWDIAGPDTVTYEQLIDRIAESMLVERPRLGLGFTLTPLAAQFAAAVAGEDPALIEPLMEGLEHDLLPRDDAAAAAFGIRLHSFDAAVERALRDWERTEEVAAR